MDKPAFNNLNVLEHYLYVEQRNLLLNLIGNNATAWKQLSYDEGINLNSIINFAKYSYEDYSLIMQGVKGWRYLSISNCLRLLDKNGFKLELRILVD